jgi:hypothetical protein
MTDSMTVKEIEELLREDSPKKNMYPATDEEVRETLENNAFPTTDFVRVGQNVVIADNAIVVVIKTHPEGYETSQWYDYPVGDSDIEHISYKKWCNRNVMNDFLRAEAILEKCNAAEHK